MLDRTHRDELYDSSLSDEMIEASGVYSEYKVSSVRDILGWSKMPKLNMIPAMVFPFRGPDGEFTGFKRIKPATPRKNKEGNSVKYEQPRGAHSRAYFTPGITPHLRSNNRIYVTEGEKKSLAMAEHIGPTIGLTGVWNWTQKQVEGRDRELIPDLQSVEWKGREVVVVFDADPEFKPQVEHAQIEFARILESHGAIVILRSIDPLRGYGKGIDDLLALEYLREEILQLVVHGGDSYIKPLEHQKERSVTRPGVYFTDAPSGSGKTLSDEILVRSMESSTTVLPTHAEAQEKAEFYRSLGVDAAAYPNLDEKTCGNYEEARTAMNFGLSPALSVCISCHLRDSCEFRQQVKAADDSQHSVGTHSRFQVTAGASAEGKKLVNIHERVIDCLRPTVRLIRDEHGVYIEAAEFVERAIDLADRSYDGDIRNRRYREWFASASRHARWARDWLSSADYMIDQPSPCAEPRGVHERIYQSLRSLAKDRRTRVNQLNEEEMAELPPDESKSLRQKAANLDRSFWKMVRSILQISMLGASGKTDSVLTIDDGKSARRIVIERDIPLNTSQVVWVQDATTTVFSVRNVLQATAKGLTVHHVRAATPDQKQAVYQLLTDFAADKEVRGYRYGITMNTSSEIVANFVRSFARSLPPSMRPLGVICHKVHRSRVEAVQKELDGIIEKVDNFGGRAARGSNAWVDPKADGSHACRCLLVIGTPRPHPTLVSERAAQVRSECLDLKQEWKTRYWPGRDRHGRLYPVPYRGFADRILDLAYHELVIAELTQCVGRARVYNQHIGCTAVVVCNEPIGIWDFNDGPLDGLKTIVVPGGGFLVRDPELMELHGRLLSASSLKEKISESWSKRVITAVNKSLLSPKHRVGWVVPSVTKSIISIPWLSIERQMANACDSTC